jgi:hypothetical protein
LFAGISFNLIPEKISSWKYSKRFVVTIHVPLQFNLFSSVIEKLFHWFYRGIIFSSQNFFLWWQPSWTSDWQNKNFWWRKCIPSNNPMADTTRHCLTMGIWI